MELRWLANSSTSCLHAATALVAGAPVTDERVRSAMMAPAERLAESLEREGFDPLTFLEHATPLALGIENNRELAALVFRKLHARERADAALSAVAESLRTCKMAYREALPKLLEELEARSGPIVEQWEARGPGMLSGVRRRTADDILAPGADVLLVHPILGGGGEAHLPYNSVRLEAVLANPRPALPEVVRLAWLLALLNLDLPRYSEPLPAESRGAVIRLSMIPATLEAAVDVELLTDPIVALPEAVATWLPRLRDPTRAAALLDSWWAAFQDGDRRWSVALAALASMLADEA